MQMKLADRRGEAEVQKSDAEERDVPKSCKPATVRCVASHPVLPVEEEPDACTGNNAG
jgi:hypothetical protein